MPTYTNLSKYPTTMLILSSDSFHAMRPIRVIVCDSLIDQQGFECEDVRVDLHEVKHQRAVLTYHCMFDEWAVQPNRNTNDGGCFG